MFPTSAGTFFFDTGALTLTGPGITTPILGTLSATGVAVFDFNGINVNPGQVFMARPPDPPSLMNPPLALLSRGGITISGTIDVGATPPFFVRSFSPGGPGGFGSDHGPGAGGAGGEIISTGGAAGGGGGGFGGHGGNGGLFTFEMSPGPGPPPIIVTPFGGGAGGSSYGDLAVALQGGSGGGSFTSRQPTIAGGGGGGAIEIGAVDGITIGGSILANGSSGSLGNGGGSGGGIFLHGSSVALLSPGVLIAMGGAGAGGNGGGGGGGRVLIQTGPGGFTGEISSINVSGGAGTNTSGLPVPPGPLGAAGAPGVVTISVVPEPASLLLLGTGLLGALGAGGLRSPNRAPKGSALPHQRMNKFKCDKVNFYKVMRM